MALLTARNLHITLGQQALVQGVSFSLKVGETVCLVGASGSGKTLTAQALMGLLPSTMQVTADTLQFADQNLLACTEKDWLRLRGAAMGMVFQEP
jgi:ABC-type microcin C transport system duplicated ATPase subunit YejF